MLRNYFESGVIVTLGVQFYLLWTFGSAIDRSLVQQSGTICAILKKGTIRAWVKVNNFQNPELLKIKS